MINQELRGVSFEIPNQYGKYLNDFLKLAERQNPQKCLIIQSEVHGRKMQSLFDCGEYCFSDLLAEAEKEESYIIHLNLQIWGEPSSKNIREVRNYQEFITSGCVMVILVYDCQYVEIYSKDPDVLLKKCKKQYGNSCAGIYKDNDSRYRFEV